MSAKPPFRQTEVADPHSSEQKLAEHKSHISDLNLQRESSTTELAFLRSKVEQLTQAQSRLEQQTQAGTSEKERLVREADEIMRALRKEEVERGTVETQLETVRSEVRRLQGIADNRERDVADLQHALAGLEAQGADVSSDKIALELEVERVKRDLAQAQEAEGQNRDELEARKSEAREKDLRLANMVGFHCLLCELDSMLKTRSRAAIREP